MKTQLGYLCIGDYFKFDGKKYKVGNIIEGTNGYIACVNAETHNVTRFHIDTFVEYEEKEGNANG